MGKTKIKPWKALFTAFITVLVLQALVLEIHQVKGPSMEPTLKDGRIVFFYKLAFGFQVPIIDRYSIIWKSPSEGEIVVFPHPRGDHFLIKRVAAGPGAPLRVENKVLYLGNRAINLDGNQSYWLSGQSKVPEGKVFVLGDNLGDSQDSRDFGFISVEDLRGIMVF